MTRGQMIFECSRALGLDDTEGSDELNLMRGWAQRGVIDVLQETKCFVDIGQMVLQSNVSDYRISEDILAVKNITLPSADQSPYELDIVDMDDLIPYLSSGVATTVTPSYAAIEGTLLRIAPTPSSAVTLTYFYVPRPTDMVDDNNDPSDVQYGGIPSEYHEAVLYYMLWKAAEYDDKGGGFYRGHAYAPGFAYQGLYDGWIAKIKKRQRRKAGRGMHAGRVGYPDTHRPVGRNDTYPRQA